MKYAQKDMNTAKDIKASAPEPKLEEEPAKPTSSVLETEKDDSTAAEPVAQRTSSFGSWLNSLFCRPSIYTIMGTEGGQETKKEIKSAHYRGEVWSVASMQDTTDGPLDNAQKYKLSDQKVMTLESIEESIEEPTEETSSSINSTDALKGEKYIPEDINETKREPNELQQRLNQIRARAETREDIEERQQSSHSRETIFSAAFSTARLKQRLTVWKLITSLELADCMPLAVFNNSFEDADSSDDLFSVEEYDDDDQYA
jgi:hypothetical protein